MRTPPCAPLNKLFGKGGFAPVFGVVVRMTGGTDSDATGRVERKGGVQKA